MKIEIYKKDTGLKVDNTGDYYFVMNNEVYCDNEKVYESQAALIGFDDCIKSRGDLGWRVIT